MNAGKSTTLLQSSYNYRERGMDTILFTPAVDDRYGVGKITSRIGLGSDAVPFNDDLDFYEYTKHFVDNNTHNLACVLLDEAQFITKDQVQQLTDIAHDIGVPVLAYGLRTGYNAEPFEGSKYLLSWADELIEIKTICHCGRKATMTMLVDENGKQVKDGPTVVIGGNEKYVSTCLKHYKLGVPGPLQLNLGENDNH